MQDDGPTRVNRRPALHTNALRLKHRDQVVQAIEAWLAAGPSDAAALEALRKARIPVAPVLSIDQAVNHPHLRARQTVCKISDRIFGEFDAPGFPLRFSAFPAFLPLTAPTLGQHNREVLDSYLGYSPERIASREQGGVLHSGKCRITEIAEARKVLNRDVRGAAPQSADCDTRKLPASGVSRY